MQILFRTMGLTMAAGVLVAMGLGLVDGAFAVWRTGSTLVVIALALALYAPCGLLAGGLLGLIGGGIRGTLPRFPVAALAALRDDRERDRKAAAGVLAGAASVVLLVVLVDIFARLVAAGMANQRLAALATALVAAGGVAVLTALFFPLWLFARPVAARVPRVAGWPATLTVLGGLVLVGGLVGLLILSRVDWRVLRFGPWVMLALMIGATIAVAWWGTREGCRPTSRVLLGLILLGCGLAAVSPAVGGRATTIGAAQQGGVLMPVLIDVGRRLADRDADGYAALFSGGDCDDQDAAVHPGARDLPGNGVDENCVGGDAQPPRASQVARAAPRDWKFDGNLLLICVDTLRADILSVLGNRGALTPNLDRLAGQGVLFRRAYAQGANTPQSFPSIFTSRYPSRVPFARTFTGYPALTQEAETVFEVLDQAGFVTTAFSSHFYFTERRGIRQGFDEWDNTGATSLRDSNKDIASPRIVPRAVARLRELAATGDKFAMFVHLFEPHSTYVRHRQYSYRLRGTAGLREKYEREVQFVDEWTGRLLDGLRETGLAKRTAVIVFSDHGEAFGEHRFYFHGQALYNEVLHVPLIAAVPGVPARVVEERVALLDLAPTLLDLVGVDTPAGFQGRTLLPLMRGTKGATRGEPVGAVLLPYPAWPKGQQTMIGARYKAIMRVTENRFELYDLQDDPAERNNLALTRPDLTRNIKAQYARFAEKMLQ